ncbi:MAG: Glu/Leu/Phe/Val dehydrogenase [Firmicutes bacterium]|nr:Glu/Leu/Phe/Val dehydrogenase [Bacillota bacterium]
MNAESGMEILLESKEPTTRSIEFVRRAGERLGLGRGIINDIINPQRVTVFRLPVKFWGKVVVVWGCMSLHNDARGPYKGGVRIAPDVSIWETVELSRLMTLKTAVMDIEFGGGKTGIRADIREMYNIFGLRERNRDFEEAMSLDICEEFAAQFKWLFRDHIYVPAPDMGTGPAEMAFIYNQTLDPASVTGKPEGVHGWLPGRKESTGYGVSYAAKRLLEDILGLRVKGARVAIQGFGNVGMHAALFLAEQGAKVVAVADLYGGAYDPSGLDIQALARHAREAGTVAGFTTPITNKELLALDVDVLLPCAAGHVLNEENSKSVRAKGIVEGANMPTTLAGMDVLVEKGIPVIPDIIANAGGVVASMEEYSRSLSALKIRREDVLRTVTEKIDESLDAAMRQASEQKISMAEASVQIAIDRVYQAMKRRRLI